MIVTRIEKTCAECGSSSLSWEAYAYWDSKYKKMQFSLYDDVYCNDCGAEDPRIITRIETNESFNNIRTL